jgi:hypothetical protein
MNEKKQLTLNIPLPTNQTLYRLLRWLTPNGGTLLLIAALILTQNVWARTEQSTANTPGPSATTVNYQGRLADSGGAPLDGTYGMSFALYDALTAGSMVWGPENHTAVPVSEGLFSVGLGSLTGGGIPTSVWDGDRYLEITVGGETLSPRELIRSVPIAGMALTVPDGAIEASKLSFTPSRFVPVQPDTNALHLTNQSSTDWIDFDLSPFVTAQTYAVSLEITAEDTSGESQLVLRRKGYTGGTFGPVVESSTGALTVNDVIIGCNEDQMIQYKIIASGSGTAAVRIRVTGYWETID